MLKIYPYIPRMRISCKDIGRSSIKKSIKDFRMIIDSSIDVNKKRKYVKSNVELAYWARGNLRQSCLFYSQCELTLRIQYKKFRIFFALLCRINFSFQLVYNFLHFYVTFWQVAYFCKKSCWSKGTSTSDPKVVVRIPVVHQIFSSKNIFKSVKKNIVTISFL